MIDVEDIVKDREFVSVCAAMLSLCNFSSNKKLSNDAIIALHGQDGIEEVVNIILAVGTHAIILKLSEKHDPLTGLFMSAADPNTDQEILTALSKSTNALLRIVTATNPSISLNTLFSLSRDPNEGVRYAALTNPTATIDIIETVPRWSDESRLAEFALIVAEKRKV